MLKERPILFSTEMVKAILEDRKTQTRRVIKPQPPTGFRAWHGLINGYQAWTTHDTQGEKGFKFEAKCPYGEPGNLLWVREKFTLECPYEHADGCGNPEHVIYWSTESPIVRESITTRWRPSIHMSHWASRITLEVVEVRVERVQDISDEDARMEGVSFELMRDAYGFQDNYRFEIAYTDLFMGLWDSINAKRGFGWDVNPWVWVIEFQLVKEHHG